MPETEALPGLETPAIAELTDAARELKEVRRERMDLTKKEVEAAERVLALMHEHKLEVYRDTNFDPPVEVSVVKGKEKVKVKLKDEDEEGEED
jgi:hypothetical protein